MRELSLKRTGLTVFTFCLGLLLMALIARHVARERDAGSTLSGADYPIKRQIQYSFALQNETNRLLERADFWTYAPVKQTATQRCERLEVSFPYELLVDDLGNQVLHFTFDRIPPFGTKIITIQAELALSDTPNLLPVPVPDTFLRPEKYIEADAPEVGQLAHKLKDPQSQNTPESIFKWVSENLRYTGYQRSDRGALYALRNKQGDCTEYMYLFAALCRANGIPARGLGGYFCSADSILKANEYHNWAEFYQDGRWRVADPQKKFFMRNGSSFIAMQVIRENPENPMGEFHRFRFVGEGLKVKMN
jgi:transglutaminase-like putative cysteine protease